MHVVKDRVQRSTSLLQSLMGERDRWQRQTDAFGEQIATLVGDVLLSSVMLSYLGMFDQEMRTTVVNQVLNRLQAAKIPVCGTPLFQECGTSLEEKEKEEKRERKH
eukprot:642507-Rhodomonas_salina.1